MTTVVREVDGNNHTGASATFSSFANAEHLDQLEASDQITDIASFQDIELPPPEESSSSNDGNNTNYNHNNHNSSSDENYASNNGGVRRAKRFYYCLPMMQQYKFMILGCFSVVVLIIVAMSLTATSVRDAKQAHIISQQMANSKNDHSAGDTIINDAPPSPTNSDYDEELGDATESDTIDSTQPPRETPFPTTAFHYDKQHPNHAPSPASSSSSSSSSSSGSSSSSTNNSSSNSSSNNTVAKPKWFTTNHEQYKSIRMSHQTYGEEMHSHSIARLFCMDLDMILCSYDEYCPDGIGQEPYEGTHDGSHLGWDVSQQEQWAPFMSSDASNADERIDWVQVGTVPDYEDGTFDNGYGRCYSFMAWSNTGEDDGGGMDIEDTIETTHRRWVLCCNDD